MDVWFVLIMVMIFNLGFICGSGWYRLFEEEEVEG